ncbi:MAG: cryptochrome/photolyase family protein [Legionellales bacterium]|nr:cryptochrome/photolyase family protein [Legionellales bacterium]OUX64514.1 MAG: cryptochrome/photolyase family protein [Gammaproteobacteria bacterium TMED281]
MSGKIYWILSDHLHETHLKDFNPSCDVVFMCEFNEDLIPVKHHKKKLVLVISGMRHFARTLIDKKYTVHYVRLDDPDHSHSIELELKKVLQKHPDHQLHVGMPSYYGLKETLKDLQLPISIVDNPQFLSTPDEFSSWSENYKVLRMEYFYRKMRVKYGILMDDQHPVGGKWNYDAENRKPPNEGLDSPPPLQINKDDITLEVIQLVNDKFKDHFGDADDFHYAVTRDDAIRVLKHFIQQSLPLFGDYQDAMIKDNVWMYHSHISFYLNCGLLSPIECIEAAEEAFEKDHAPIAAVEGFIRQVLGWREFIRGIYWLKMPEYEHLNALNANHSLPQFYWDANTKMNCIKDAVETTHKNAYAHHIQRLMITGNYALLTGIAPKAINEWYWIVYADAYHWVELPNVIGMATFSDGGVLASKPYAASGSYINKMSNYCKSCHYDIKLKHGEKACPFNYLYWSFIQKNQALLEGNPRMKFVFNQLKKLKNLPEILESAETFIKTNHPK